MRTCDVGVIDADGYLLIVDRLKDMISVGGFKVFPSQIEAVLYRHAAVREALAIAVPDDYSGERPKAFVTLNEDAKIDGEELKTRSEEHTSELQSLMRISYAVFCLKKKKQK